ncbi:hypothetical protein R1flu_028179 [Riccia fluitans]|uniref:Uncharacterized protein n=1 Tax=Riccia fluitans TaxID=41844 RepID=A0ABD1XKZ3_9MARC
MSAATGNCEIRRIWRPTLENMSTPPYLRTGINHGRCTKRTDTERDNKPTRPPYELIMKHSRNENDYNARPCPPLKLPSDSDGINADEFDSDGHQIPPSCIRAHLVELADCLLLQPRVPLALTFGVNQELGPTS